MMLAIEFSEPDNRYLNLGAGQLSTETTRPPTELVNSASSEHGRKSARHRNELRPRQLGPIQVGLSTAVRRDSKDEPEETDVTLHECNNTPTVQH